MRVVMFYHSLVSDWNHGNAHFLRGVASELLRRGHAVEIFEPAAAWSRANLVAGHGTSPIDAFHSAYPHLRSSIYEPATIDLDRALDGAGLVIVHEWNDPALVRRIGRHRARGGRYHLLFHDTHHRSLTDREHIAGAGLDDYDGVLAYGRVIRDLYLAKNWAPRAWVWHEAADTTVFHPFPRTTVAGDVVWIGNWGDDERTEEIHEFFIDPVTRLGLRASVYGVRYPDSARAALSQAGIEYRGWLPNFEVPRVFAQFRATVHIPRRPYVRALPGIPTIRVFEALACGIPLISAPWDDCEHLFHPGRDFLAARDETEMRRALRDVIGDAGLARELTAHGLATIRARHTCAHRVDELLAICSELDAKPAEAAA